MLGITKLDKEKNQFIRQKTGAQNMVLPYFSVLIAFKVFGWAKMFGINPYPANV